MIISLQVTGSWLPVASDLTGKREAGTCNYWKNEQLAGGVRVRRATHVTHLPAA